MPRDLTSLFAPSSVAIVGASNDPAKWGNWLARGALRGRDRRSVYLINRNGAEVLGEPTYTSIQELPQAPELVVISVPAAGFEQAVDDALAAGARALVGITAGLGEAGGEAAARERALVERVRGAGAMLLGPNCLGVFDAASGLDLLSNDLPSGSIGLISQSGNLALELGILAVGQGTGFSRFASIGNQSDIDLAELVASFAADDATDIIAIYVEDFRDGRAFVDAAAAAGKPVVLITVGFGEASTRAAASHTGALVSSAAVVDAACRAAGAHRVSTPTQMIDLAQALMQPLRMRGNRIAVLGDGGGHGAIACDAAEARGLAVNELSAGVQERLRATLPVTSATGNPVDLAGAGEQDFNSYANCARALVEADEVDGLLLTGYFGGYSQYSQEFLELENEVAKAIVQTSTDTGKPIVAQLMHHDKVPSATLRRGGVAVYHTIESAAAAMAALLPAQPPTGAPAIPAPVAGELDDGYHASRELLAAAGVPFVAAERVSGREQALTAADGLGYPVVLKAMGLLHKSDSGGVRVGIAGEEELAQALDDMQTRLAPPGYSVEAMAPLGDGVELIVGAKRDLRFGPVALVGLGGVYAEVLRDVAVGLAPLDHAAALRLLRSLSGAALLGGVRGRPPLDLDAAAEATVALTRLAASRPDIAEIEINPLLVLPEGALALDARIIPQKGADDAG